MTEMEEYAEELLDVFIEEFEELLDLYLECLKILRNVHGDHEAAVKDLFRIYHTLKGDSGFFPRFHHFTDFVSFYCEILRPQDTVVVTDKKFIAIMSMNYSRLSSVLLSIKKGQSLTAFRFDRIAD